MILSLAMVTFSKNYYPVILMIYIFCIAEDEIKRERFYGIINYLQNDE